MGTLIVIEGDKVEGTDIHNVSGPGTTPSGSATYKGIASYDYKGKMTDELSDFFSIDRKAVAVKTSKSSLNPGETVPPIGGHSGPAGSSFTPPETSPITATIPLLKIDDTVGEGVPNASAGSSFIKIDGVEVLLDGDSIDTCDGMSTPANSTVTSENQDFVSCSE